MSAIPFLKPHFFRHARTHTHILYTRTCKAEVLKGVAGLSHPSSGALVKVLLPPLGSSQEIKHML